MKVLVVDDEKAVESLFNQWFENEIAQGIFEFVFALSAERALEILASQSNAKIVLILSDINMPGMNGIELLKQIKKIYPHLIVLIVTAYGDEFNYQIAMKHGADGFIEKPINLALLKEKMVQFSKKQVT